jgi:hypothetical protein
VSSKNVSQTRLPPALRHKRNFRMSACIPHSVGACPRAPVAFQADARDAGRVGCLAPFRSNACAGSAPSRSWTCGRAAVAGRIVLSEAKIRQPV